jgi:hypothetical protein
MAQPGPKPKPEDQRRNQNRPAVDWIQVVDVPYAGPVPGLGGRVPVRTMRWWAVVSKLPHAINWTDGDWEFAVASAWVHAAFVKNQGSPSYASELRQREKLLGLTSDARRDLRIKYVEASAAADDAEQPVSLADRRRELQG